MFFPKTQKYEDLERFTKNGYKSVITDTLPLDCNFFRSKKEIGCVFKKFKTIGENEICGIFEVQYINEPLYLKIILLEGYNFTAEIRYFRNNMKNFIQPLL